MQDKANQNETQEFVVTTNEQRQRLDLFLATKLKDLGFSRQRIKQLIQQGEAKINDLPCSIPKQELHAGDKILLNLPSYTSEEIIPQAGNLAIIYQDEDLLVLNKPPFLTVHPCPSCPDKTLVNILLHHFPNIAKLPGLRPGIVHRLDKNTSGLLLVALKEEVRLKLADAFANRLVKKHYLALVAGVPKQEQAIIDQPIARHPLLKTRMAIVPGGKNAISKFQVLWPNQQQQQEKNQAALLDVEIFTGRTHQIRVHLAHQGHPIWGDSLYGGPCRLFEEQLLPKASKANSKSGVLTTPQPAPQIANRQMLHAHKLAFKHPTSGEELEFTCPLPSDFKQALADLAFSPLQVVLTGLAGCGKSALLQALHEQGIPIFSADENVALEYAQGNTGWQLLKARYGNKFFNQDESLNKRYLFEAMQNSQALHREVEELIHPLIAHNLQIFWQQQASKPFSVAEVPLFLEAGWHKHANNCSNIFNIIPTPPGLKLNLKAPCLDFILIGVDCPQTLRYERLAKRGVSQEMAASLDSWQWAEKDKMAACNIIIDNAASLEALQKNAAQLAQYLNSLFIQKQKLILQNILNRIE